MKYRLELSEFRLFPIASKSRAILVTVAMLTLASCASQGAREAELAAVEAERIAMEQEAAQVAVEQERARAAQLQRQREQAEAERARVQAQRDRQLAEARARAEAERQVAEAEEQRERERLAAIVAVEAQRQEKLDRIAALGRSPQFRPMWSMRNRELLVWRRLWRSPKSSWLFWKTSRINTRIPMRLEIPWSP